MAEKKFLIENYGKKSTFASFLPGISGEKGIPIWCYYVNRGQCVVSFGVDNKDHSIMEFYPAHQAYQNVKTTGFRTFVKKDGKVTELFADENRTHRMEIARNGLKIEEENDVLGVNAKVDYFTLPGEKIGALVRKVELTNATGEHAKIEVLEELEVRVFTEANWGNEAQYRIEITNNTKIDIKEWTITFTLEDDKKILSVWDGWANLVSNVGKNQLKSSDGKAMSTGEWVNELKIGQTQIVKGNFTGGSDIGEVRINSIITSYK